MHLKLVQIRIELASTSVNWDLLKQLKKDVLSNDKYWHFFWEGDYTLIRCPSRRVRKVVKWLESRDIECTVEGPYQDNIPITRKYGDEFVPMFHVFLSLQSS